MIKKILIFSVLILMAFNSYAQEEEVPVFEDSSIGREKKVTHKSYNYSRGEKLPEHLEAYDDLRRIAIYHIKDNEFPAVFSKLKNLKSLTIISDHLEQIPEQIGYLTDLEFLDIKIDMLVSVPATIGKLKNLKSLTISGLESNMELLPDEIGELYSLEKLYIRSESLTILPDVFSNLDSLKSVKFFKTGIVKLPASFYQLKNLEKLHIISCGSFSELSEDISQLSKLRSLGIHESALENLPEGIGELEDLRGLNITPMYKSLDFSMNWRKLKKLENLNLKSVIDPEALLDSICLARLPQLKSISISVRTPFPIKENLNDLVALEKISFRNTIPIIQGNLIRLKKLCLFDIRKGFENFSTIKRIINLESIVFAKSDYSDEDLEHCFDDLAEMSSLESVHVGNNKLKEFPTQLLALENLTDLNVINNDITTIPKECYLKKGFWKLTLGGKQKKNIGADVLNDLKTKNPNILL